MLRSVENVYGASRGFGRNEVRVLRHVSSAVDFVFMRYPLDDLDARWVRVPTVATQL